MLAFYTPWIYVHRLSIRLLSTLLTISIECWPVYKQMSFCADLSHIDILK